MYRQTLFIILVLGLMGCKTQKYLTIFENEDLIIRQLSPNAFLHISYLQTTSFGKVACNGIIIRDQGEAVVVDSPADSSTAALLINQVEQKLAAKVTEVVPTHFHIDCLGGLSAFHAREIPSYAHQMTIDLAQESATKPLFGFEIFREIKVGNVYLPLDYPGEGHTKDNIVVYFPEEQILFGGCLIKSLGAGKGNLEDANVDTWASTVEKVKEQYGDAKIVVPGHGKPGGIKLLDYTIEMFSMKN